MSPTTTSHAAAHIENDSLPQACHAACPIEGEEGGQGGLASADLRPPIGAWSPTHKRSALRPLKGAGVLAAYRLLVWISVPSGLQQPSSGVTNDVRSMCDGCGGWFWDLPSVPIRSRSPCPEIAGLAARLPRSHACRTRPVISSGRRSCRGGSAANDHDCPNGDLKHATRPARIGQRPPLMKLI